MKIIYIIFAFCLTAVFFVIACWKDRGEKSDYSEEKQIEKYQSVISSIPNSESLVAGRGNSNNNFYHVGLGPWLNDTSDISGLAFETNVIKLRLGNAKIQSIWEAFYFTYWNNGELQTTWIQWGYAVSKDWGLIPAFQIWGVSGSNGLPYTLTYAPNPEPLQYGTTVRFSMVNIPGTTQWGCYRNGSLIFDVDLHTATIKRRIQLYTESWGSDTYNSVLNVNYFDIQNPETKEWNHLEGGMITSARIWNIEGKNQIPSFQKSQVTFGGKIQNPDDPNYWLLWNQ